MSVMFQSDDEKSKKKKSKRDSRRTSILKCRSPSNVLGDLDTADTDNLTVGRRESRRVSFAETFQVKEFRNEFLHIEDVENCPVESQSSNPTGLSHLLKAPIKSEFHLNPAVVPQPMSDVHVFDEDKAPQSLSPEHPFNSVANQSLAPSSGDTFRQWQNETTRVYDDMEMTACNADATNVLQESCNVQPPISEQTIIFNDCDMDLTLCLGQNQRNDQNAHVTMKDAFSPDEVQPDDAMNAKGRGLLTRLNQISQEWGRQPLPHPINTEEHISSRGSSTSFHLPDSNRTLLLHESMEMTQIVTESPSPAASWANKTILCGDEMDFTNVVSLPDNAAVGNKTILKCEDMEFTCMDVGSPQNSLAEGHEYLNMTVVCERKEEDDEDMKEREAERMRVDEENKKGFFEQEKRMRIEKENRLKIEEEKRRVEEEKRMRIEEENRMKIEEEKRRIEEEKRMRIEEEKRMRIEEENQIKIEEEKRRIEEEKRMRIEEENRMKIEEEKRRIEEEKRMRIEEENLMKIEEEKRRIEEEKRMRIEEENRMKIEEEKRRIEEEKRMIIEEENRMKIEEEKRRTEEEKRMRIEKENRMKIDQDKMRNEEIQEMQMKTDERMTIVEAKKEEETSEDEEAKALSEHTATVKKFLDLKRRSGLLPPPELTKIAKLSSHESCDGAEEDGILEENSMELAETSSFMETKVEEEEVENNEERSEVSRMSANSIHEQSTLAQIYGSHKDILMQMGDQMIPSDKVDGHLFDELLELYGRNFRCERPKRISMQPFNVTTNEGLSDVLKLGFVQPEVEIQKWVIEQMNTLTEQFRGKIKLLKDHMTEHPPEILRDKPSAEVIEKLADLQSHCYAQSKRDLKIWKVKILSRLKEVWEAEQETLLAAEAELDERLAEVDAKTERIHQNAEVFEETKRRWRNHQECEESERKLAAEEARTRREEELRRDVEVLKQRLETAKEESVIGKRRQEEKQRREEEELKVLKQRSARYSKCLAFKIEAWSPSGAQFSFLKGRVCLNVTFGPELPEVTSGSMPAYSVTNVSVESKLVPGASEGVRSSERFIVAVFLSSFNREDFLCGCSCSLQLPQAMVKLSTLAVKLKHFYMDFESLLTPMTLSDHSLSVRFSSISSHAVFSLEFTFNSWDSDMNWVLHSMIGTVKSSDIEAALQDVPLKLANIRQITSKIHDFLKHRN